MYALALSLDDAGAKPKIVGCDQFFELRPNHVGVKLQPKSKDDFKKGLEYGRLKVVAGKRKLVRHIIFRLDG